MWSLSETELTDEWEVAYATRLGNLCAAGKPTDAQDKIARDEAHQHVEALRKQNEPLDGSVKP